MNADQFKQLKNDKNLKVGKNQIYFDFHNSIFIVEQFEFTDSNNIDMFSCLDGFDSFEEAYRWAKNPEQYKILIL